jgi:hypothetical protein
MQRFPAGAFAVHSSKERTPRRDGDLDLTRRSHGIASPAGADAARDRILVRDGAHNGHSAPETRGPGAAWSVSAPPTPHHASTVCLYMSCD